MPKDDFSKQINKFLKGVKETVEGSVKMKDLYTDEFMKRNTDFDNIDEFFESSPYEIETQEDFENIQQEDFDEHVNKHTKFTTWEEFSKTAGVEYAQRKLKEKGYKTK